MPVTTTAYMYIYRAVVVTGKISKNNIYIYIYVKIFTDRYCILIKIIMLPELFFDILPVTTTAYMYWRGKVVGRAS